MSQPKVLVIDAGLGNVGSVVAAMEREECETKRLTEPLSEEESWMFTHAILPGVGSFAAGMKALENRGWDRWLRDIWCDQERPLLGICLGMQLMASEGTEGTGEKGIVSGLNLIPGKVNQMEQIENLVLPHVGWNDLEWKKPMEGIAKGLKDNDDMYFVHSYTFRTYNANNILAESKYGKKFTAAIGEKNCYGVQFHPEKSQRAGRRLLKNFLEIKKC